MKNIRVPLFIIRKLAKELISLPASILWFKRSWQSWTCLRVTDKDEIGDRPNDPEIGIVAQLVEEIVCAWELVKWLQKTKLHQWNKKNFKQNPEKRLF